MTNHIPKIFNLLIVQILTGGAVLTAQTLPEWYERSQGHAEDQIQAVVEDVIHLLPYSGSGNIEIYPFETKVDGSGNTEWVYNNWTRWGAGFFPGQLWQISFVDSSEDWTNWADLWSEAVFGWKTREDHDIGFNLLTTAGLGYDRTGDSEYLDILHEGAETFSSSHWMPAVGSLWSFNFSNFRTSYGRPIGGFRAFQNVIIDTSMNIGLLFKASREGGDPLWAERGLSHMRNTYRDLVREDGGTIQIVDYYTKDEVDNEIQELIPAGSVRGKYGWQGYSQDTSWSRGQAWAIHGFTTAFKETGDPQMLEAARKVADYWIENVPDDHVPYWDFDALDPEKVPDEFYDLLIADDKLPVGWDRDLDNAKDSSAAAIAASGLLELAVISGSEEGYTKYMNEALAILETLSVSGEYLTIGMPYESILAQGTYSFPGSDKGLSWGEYYFVEALERYRQHFDKSIPFSGDDGYNTRIAFEESNEKWWQTKWMEGKPRYVLSAAQESSWGDLPFAYSILTEENVFDHYKLSLEVGSTSNLGTAKEAAVVVVIGYEDALNYAFVKLSSLDFKGGFYEVVDGEVEKIATMAEAYLRDYKFENLEIIVENGILEVRRDDMTLMGANLSNHSVTGGFIGVGGMSGGAAFSNLKIEEITDLRQAQTIINPNIADASVYGDVIPTAFWVTDAGLPVSVNLLSGPAYLNEAGEIVATGIGSVQLLLTQAGNETYSPAGELTVSFNIYAGSLSYAEWATVNELPMDPLVDSNADGYPNLYSFASGMDANDPFADDLLKTELVMNGEVETAQFSYLSSTQANVYIQLVQSSDGKSWVPVLEIENTTMEKVATEVSAQERVTVAIPLDGEAGPFFRLLYQLPN